MWVLIHKRIWQVTYPRWRCRVGTYRTRFLMCMDEGLGIYIECTQLLVHARFQSDCIVAYSPLYLEFSSGKLEAERWYHHSVWYHNVNVVSKCQHSIKMSMWYITMSMWYHNSNVVSQCQCGIKIWMWYITMSMWYHNPNVVSQSQYGITVSMWYHNSNEVLGYQCGITIMSVWIYDSVAS